MVKNFLAYLLFSAILVVIFVTSYETISIYYNANPYINGIILLTLVVGFLLYTVKIISLSSEYRFMNSGIISSSKTITKTLEEILDELLSIIESGKDISKYLINLAVFLGLIGTFYGLLLTIGSVTNVIDGLSIEQQDFGVFFNTLRDGLKSPLSGMTIAFSSSLFGLVTSCENQIRLYYRSSPKSKADSSNLTQVLNSKLDELVNGINKINENLNNSNKELKEEIITELKTVSKSIKNLENK